MFNPEERIPIVTIDHEDVLFIELGYLVLASEDILGALDPSVSTRYKTWYNTFKEALTGTMCFREFIVKMNFSGKALKILCSHNIFDEFNDFSYKIKFE